ncbi:hypothetical protein RSAG8_12005, partial [Rhizoctonia solani AG-8 WAC10335]
MRQATLGYGTDLLVCLFVNMSVIRAMYNAHEQGIVGATDVSYCKRAIVLTALAVGSNGISGCRYPINA